MTTNIFKWIKTVLEIVSMEELQEADMRYVTRMELKISM